MDIQWRSVTAASLLLLGASLSHADDRWSFVGGGVNGDVHAVTTWQIGSSGPTVLVVGGSFTTVGASTAANNIAIWDGNAWHALGSGITSSAGQAVVRALAVFNGELVVGGDFTTAGGNTASCLARWNNSTQTWSSVAGGVVRKSRAITGVFSLLTAQGNSGQRLFVGGYFDQVGIAAFGSQNLASTNGTTWYSPIPNSANAIGPADTEVDSGVWSLLATGPDEVGVFGKFTGYYGIDPSNSMGTYYLASGMTKLLWNGHTPQLFTWTSVGGDAGVFTSSGRGIIRASTYHQGLRILTGDFRDIDGASGGGTFFGIVANTGNFIWQPVLPGISTPASGAGNQGYSLLSDGQYLYVGGKIPFLSGQTASSGSISLNPNNVVRYTGQTWEPMGTGVVSGTPSTSIPLVRSLGKFNDSIIVAGSFANAGGKTITNRYSLASWKPCPGDFDHNSSVDDVDFAQFATAYDALYCTPGSACPCDFNHDGFVDDTDFVIFANAYDQLVCPT